MKPPPYIVVPLYGGRIYRGLGGFVGGCLCACRKNCYEEICRNPCIWLCFFVSLQLRGIEASPSYLTSPPIRGGTGIGGGKRLRWGWSGPELPASCANRLRTMSRHAPHHAPRPSASCPDALRTVCRGRPHHVPRGSASYAQPALTAAPAHCRTCAPVRLSTCAFHPSQHRQSFRCTTSAGLYARQRTCQHRAYASGGTP